MRFRNGCVYIKRINKGLRVASLIKITQRNCSRSFGIVRFININTGRKGEARSQKLKGFIPLWGY